MCEYIFSTLPVLQIIAAISGFTSIILARMSILKIKDKLTKEDFFSIFPKSNNEFKVMNLNTQLKLYKILFLNSYNIQK